MVKAYLRRIAEGRTFRMLLRTKMISPRLSKLKGFYENFLRYIIQRTPACLRGIIDVF